MPERSRPAWKDIVYHKTRRDDFVGDSTRHNWSGSYRRRCRNRVLAHSLAAVGLLGAFGCAPPPPMKVAPSGAVENNNTLRGAALPVSTATSGDQQENTPSNGPLPEAPSSSSGNPPETGTWVNNRLMEYIAHPANVMIESVGNGAATMFRREWEGVRLDYMIIYPQHPNIHFDLLFADGAVPAQNWSQFQWQDGGHHEDTYPEMSVGDETKVIDGVPASLIAIGPPTYGGPVMEGTVMEVPDIPPPPDVRVEANGAVLWHLNDRRASLAIDTTGRAHIGVFSEQTIQQQGMKTIIGGGPVVILPGPDGSPRVATTGEIGPEDMGWDPKGEDFWNMNDRITFYNSVHPATMTGIGIDANGNQFMVLAISTGLTQRGLALELARMGANHALINDGDTFGRLSWFGRSGTPVHREWTGDGMNRVAGALAIYYSGQ